MPLALRRDPARRLQPAAAPREDYRYHYYHHHYHYHEYHHHHVHYYHYVLITLSTNIK